MLLQSTLRSSQTWCFNNNKHNNTTTTTNTTIPQQQQTQQYHSNNKHYNTTTSSTTTSKKHHNTIPPHQQQQQTLQYHPNNNNNNNKHNNTANHPNISPGEEREQETISGGQRRQIQHKKGDQMAVREFPVTITSPLAGWTDRQSFTVALGAIDLWPNRYYSR